MSAVEVLEFSFVEAVTSVPVAISEAKGVEFAGWFTKLGKIVVNIVNMFQETQLEFSGVLKVTPEGGLTYRMRLEVSKDGNKNDMMIYDTKVLVSSLNPPPQLKLPSGQEC
ncbi:hypothetical protein Hdeb2414_s0018g00537241 [Helianthus debilis subsp. tardiflorus]